MKDKNFAQISIFIILFIVGAFALGYNLTIIEVQKNDPSKLAPKVLSVNKKSDLVTPTEIKPKSITSSEAFFVLQNLINEQYPDSKILSCSGEPNALNYIDGLFPNWNCEFYSQNGGFDSKVIWNEGKTEILTPHQIWYVEDSTIDPTARNFYNPLEFIDSKFIYSRLIISGYSPEKEYYKLILGDSMNTNEYTSTKIWQAKVYSKTGIVKNEDGSTSENLLRSVLFDAETGKMIDII